MGHKDLIKSLQDNLFMYNYTELPVETCINGEKGILIMTPRCKTIRYILGVFDLCINYKNTNQINHLLESIRKALSKKYAKFPYYKELQTFLVFVCSSVFFESLIENYTQLNDSHGFHSNVILGTILIDRDNFFWTANPTWGLNIAGKHFSAICVTVHEWCKKNRLCVNL